MAEYIEREAVLALKQTPGAYGMDISSAEVKVIPAADVAPLRHGHLTPTNDRPRTWKFCCDQCGGIAYFPQPKYFSHGCGYRYCPNCGAKIDGGET